MPESYGYTGGTITITSGSAAITATGSAWLSGALGGDTLVQNNTIIGWIETVTSNTAATLRKNAAASYTGTDYIILHTSALRHDVTRLSERYARWHRDAAYAINTTGIPDNAIGQDGWIAFDYAAGISYTKAAGVWGGATQMRLRPRGAYSAGTAYLAGDVVTNQSASWASITGSTGVAPPTLPTESNAQWTMIARSGALTPSGTITADRAAIWVDGVSVKSTNDIRVTSDGVGVKADPMASVALTVGGKIDVGGTLFLNGSDYSGWSTFWSPGALYFATPYGYLGVNGSTRLGLFWNGYRNNAAGWTSLGQGGGTPDIACAIEMGASGIDFSGETPTVSGVTPTLRARITPEGKFGIGTAAPTATIDNNGDTYRQRTARTPASATAAGNQGDHCWDASYLYVCTATNTWKRAALSTW